jgi:hypothetical protein
MSEPADELPPEEKTLRYGPTIERVFLSAYAAALQGTQTQPPDPDPTLIVVHGDTLRASLVANGLKVGNLYDMIYFFKVRAPLPASIRAMGHWGLDSLGKGYYGFRKLKNKPQIEIDFDDIAPVSVYNAVPELIDGYLRHDEQSMLSRILYNRLIDIYIGMSCWLAQNHYRSQIAVQFGSAEVEVDALYAGVDSQGHQHAIGIEAKSHAKSEMINRIQLSNMARMLRERFPEAIPIILAVKMLQDGDIGLVRFQDGALEPDEFLYRHPVRYQIIRRSGRTDAPPPRGGRRTGRQSR